MTATTPATTTIKLTSLLTWIRLHVLEPVVPPPVVTRIRYDWDPYLWQHYRVEEGSVAILLQVLLLSLVTSLLWQWQQRRRRRRRQRFGAQEDNDYRTSTGRRAVVEQRHDDDDQDDPDWWKRNDYLSPTSQLKLLSSTTATSNSTVVVLCGPPQSGKTTLWAHLVALLQSPKPSKSQSQSQSTELFPTVTSRQANVWVVAAQDTTPVVKLVDWPGHAATLQTTTATTTTTNNDSNNNNTAMTTFVRQNGVLRQLLLARSNNNSCLLFVVVLDATQSVKEAAVVLYQVWHELSVQQQSQSKQQRKGQQSFLPRIVVACHKSDPQNKSVMNHKKVKTTRRIQLQLRSELEKLLALYRPEWWTAYDTTASFDLSSSTTAASSSSSSSTNNDNTNVLSGQLPPYNIPWQLVATSCLVDDKDKDDSSSSSSSSSLHSFLSVLLPKEEEESK